MSTPLAVSCPHCGAGLKLKNNSFVGKKVPCPKCKKPFVVEEPPEDEFLAGDDDDFVAMDEPEEEPEEPRPKSKSKGAKDTKGKKKKSKGGGFAPIAMLVGGVVLGLGLIGGIGYGVITLLSGMGSNSWVKWLPADTEMVIQVRVADAMNAPIFKPITDHPTLSKLMNRPPAPGNAAGDPTTAFLQGLGIQSKDIDTLTVGIANIQSGGAVFGGGDKPPQQFVAVIRLKTAVEESKLVQAPATVLVKEDYNGKSVYAIANATNPRVLVHAVNSTTYLVGSDAELKAAIDGKGASPADKRFAYVNSKPHFVFAAAPNDPAKLKSSSNSGLPPSAERPQISDGTEAVALTVELGSDAKLMVFSIGNEASATANADGMKKSLDQAKAGIQAQKSQNVGFIPFVSQDSINKLTAHVESMLNGAQVDTNGKTATLTMTLPGLIVNDALAMAAPIMPMLETMVAEQEKAAAAGAAATSKSTFGNSVMDITSAPGVIIDAGEKSKTKINALNDQHQADLEAQMQEGNSPAPAAHAAPAADPNAADPNAADPAKAAHGSPMTPPDAAANQGSPSPMAAMNNAPAAAENAGGNDPAKVVHEAPGAAPAGEAAGNAAANGQDPNNPAAKPATTKSRSRRRTTTTP